MGVTQGDGGGISEKNQYAVFEENGIFIEEGCVVEEGAKIYAPAHISGGAHIERGAIIYPYCHITSSYVGGGTTVYSSTLTGAHVGRDCTVGPYAYLRDGAKISDGCRIGDFVEVKNSTLKEGCKAAHLAYIGDAEIGENCNIGCGVVFCNYDGKNKHRCSIGRGVFIGANCNLIAPVVVEDGAFIAAGSTLTCDLGEGDFCIARQRERVQRGGAKGRYIRGNKNG